MLDENPTYQAELNQNLEIANKQIEKLMKQNKGDGVRLNLQSIALTKQTKQDQNKTSDHDKKLKSKSDELQVVIFELTNAMTNDQKTKLQQETLNGKIDQLKSQLAQL